MCRQIVTSQVDDSTTATFEIEPSTGFHPAAPGYALGQVRDAEAPAVEVAKTDLYKIKEVRPDDIELAFGIMVSGGNDWLIAEPDGEGSLEIKPTWSREVRLDDEVGHKSTATERGERDATGEDAADPAQEW